MYDRQLNICTNYNSYVEWGYNRDREKREQINIARISAYESNTSRWCTELPGSMSDQIALEYVS